MPTFLILLFAYLFSQFFRSFVSIIAADLTRDLGFGPAELGWISSSWFMAFAISQFPVGYLLDTRGPRRTMGWLMTFGVIGGLVFAASNGLTMSMTGMALVGVGCSPMLMAGLYIFGRTSPPERFAVLSSLLVGFGNVGNLVAATPLAFAASTIGWRTSMAAVSLAMAVATALVLLLLKDPPPVERRDGKASMLGDILTLLKIRALWFVLPIHLFGYAAVATERGLWIGPFLQSVHGLDAIFRGNIAFAMSVGMACGALACGPAARLLNGPKLPAVIATAVTAALFLLLAIFPQLPVPVVATVLTAIGFFGLTYSLLLSHGRPFLPDYLLGRGVTFLNFLAIGGAGLMQAVTGNAMEKALLGGVAPAGAYSILHGGIGATLVIVLVLFLRAPARPSPARPPPARP